MAAPISNQHPSNTAGPSAASWSRGSASSSLSRGGRGRGSGRGRNGRSSRGGLRETKVIGADSSNNESNPVSSLKPAPTPSTKSAASSPTATDKRPAVPNVSPSGRPRRNLRRNQQMRGRNETPPVVADAPSKPASSKSASRRRRSQTRKTAPISNVIHVSSRDDNHPRLNVPSTGTVPLVAPIKDTPPHLTSNFINKHSDVDAVLDRVGVVHIGDRAHTPGSHIDWAGDDDDSLPDLDDWGITSVKAAINENELMSPLGVKNLRPLPDIVTDADSSPRRETLILTETFPNQIETTPHQAKSSTDGQSASGDAHVAAPITITQEPLVSDPASAKVSLCPFLPPYVADGVLQDEVVLVETEMTPPGAEAELELATSIHSPDARIDKEDPFSNLLARNGLSGLSASIHAPHPVGMIETKSVPSDMSVHSSSDHRTHNRSHEISRPPSCLQAGDGNRPSRSGYNTPRGRLSAYHSRTHSTPPAGSHTHRSSAHRPVLTGAALSRLAKTISGTTPSPARVPAISTAQE
ncbi:hypothetical protein C0992_003623 [Termitomyces sp. T32_za158]|nr:hypothetical protein C0992_003623 [Termitomyces sp. T32_za158]